MLIRKDRLPDITADTNFKPMLNIGIKSNATDDDKEFIHIIINTEDIQDIKALYRIDLLEDIRNFYLKYGFYVEALRKGKSIGDLSKY